ncbi:MAG: YajG family lipoprotein [Deltaproteobacteria bacterium]|nr:YajG family lipoprotein [Deltaproteobacteria bacterium]
MNKIVLLTCVLFLTGCGVKYPETANLKLMVPSQSVAVYTNSTVLVNGLDARENGEVLIYKVKDDPVVKVPSLNSPITVITDGLLDGMREQGLKVETTAPVRIDLELNQLLVTVSKSKSLYNFKAVSQITLKAMNDKNSFIKKYSRQDDRKSVLRPKITEIENMLNGQLSDIVTKILSDLDLRELITNR